jgi:hypothetical protein
LLQKTINTVGVIEADAVMRHFENHYSFNHRSFLLLLCTTCLGLLRYRMRSNRVLRRQGAEFLLENSADVIQDLTLGALNHVVNA